MARYDFSGMYGVDEVAQGGAADALLALGLMYCTGREVDVDFVQAHKWLNLAALRGNAEAKHYRQEIAAEMTKAQISKAQRLAREWLAVR